MLNNTIPVAWLVTVISLPEKWTDAVSLMTLGQKVSVRICVGTKLLLFLVFSAP
jgi:hypothetical protein